MATHVREDAGIEGVIDTVEAIAGGLEADPLTGSLAPAWNALVTRGDGLADVMRTTRRATRRARQRVAIADARWDEEVAAFGRAVFDASNGKRDVAPYTRFFRDATPSQVQNLGPARAREAAERWIVELGRDATEPLAVEWIPRLRAVTDALGTAHDDRDAADRAEQPARTAVRLYIADLNQEIDRLEGELLRIFAGPRRARVPTFLEPLRTDRRTSKRAGGEGE